MMTLLSTWKRRISRGLPAFLRQFWLHFRKNFNWNLGNVDMVTYSAFLRGGQIHILSWTLSGNVFPFWRMRQTHTRTCLPLTNKHSQTHIDIHKYTLIDTHKHIHTHKLTHTKTNACTQCFPIKAGYNLRSDWEWNVNLKKIRMQDLQGGFLTGSPLN